MHTSNGTRAPSFADVARASSHPARPVRPELWPDKSINKGNTKEESDHARVDRRNWVYSPVAVLVDCARPVAALSMLKFQLLNASWVEDDVLRMSA